MFKKYLIVFFISMVPLIELRGAIPVGLSTAFGPACTTPSQILLLYFISILGNMLPVPIIFFFARKVLEWGADKKFIGKFFTFCLEKGKKVEKSYNLLQVKEFIGHYSYLLVYHFQGQVLGQEHVQQVYLI